MSHWSPFAIEAAKQETRAIERREYHRLCSNAARKERLRTEFELATTLCLNCYGLGHRRETCLDQGIIACSRCFLLNRFTKSCKCDQTDDKMSPTGQVFRMAGDPDKPLFYADVHILFKNFEAQISTGQSECTINHHMAKWLQELTDLNKEVLVYMMVPITHRNETIEINCKVIRYQEHEIILGTEYLMKKRFTFTFDRIILNERSIVLPHSRQLQRVYNLSPRGDALRRYIKKQGGTLHPENNYQLSDWPPINQPQKLDDENHYEKDVIRLDVGSDAEDIEKL